jgi:hypothetical protein
MVRPHTSIGYRAPAREVFVPASLHCRLLHPDPLPGHASETRAFMVEPSRPRLSKQVDAKRPYPNRDLDHSFGHYRYALVISYLAY